MPKYCTIVFLAFFTPNSFAGYGTGKITFLLVNQDTTPNRVVFNIENYSAHPCAAPNPQLGELKFDISSEKGIGMLSLLLSAEAQDKIITVQGAGLYIEQDRETASWISIGDPTL